MNLEDQMIDYAVSRGFSKNMAVALMESVKRGNRGAYTLTFRLALRDYLDTVTS